MRPAPDTSAVYSLEPIAFAGNVPPSADEVPAGRLQETGHGERHSSSDHPVEEKEQIGAIGCRSVLATALCGVAAIVFGGFAATSGAEIGGREMPRSGSFDLWPIACFIHGCGVASAAFFGSVIILLIVGKPGPIGRNCICFVVAIAISCCVGYVKFGRG